MVAIPADNRILYFERDRDAFRFLSHFHASPIIIDGEAWQTVEHFYQAQKSLSLAYRYAIKAAPTPNLAKKMAAHPNAKARLVKHSWFRAHGQEPRSDWNEVKLDIMRRGDEAKYAQHADLAALLLATRSAELVEDSPNEPFWGIGKDGNGPNWAGRVLMEVREALQTMP